ncbi:MAG TPA: FtsQ-type POTRA domain-containing protein [Halanaerobiaceae bacterium]|jgi:cell division protein FtsQ|nr:FtsQ-type POTRA domain-containing protein [Bacillota bacterium]HHU91608.1 FtsQ-type POTRA domain-containing protein [Halanaerobiaceae bacterium]HOA40732.1 FtsQ-type POTRA domain-containing protein [Halanaerobiales bacterium]HPZ62234.1 FtsQ-type POTRA domain-containing protein [Halanaerobiales bacterium]HQD03610.1 FtsQ-type POTRA domain-containing protein [Halanaerobiales bacterium]
MSDNKLLYYIIAFISLLALISFALSPFFEIRSIEVNGLYILSRGELEYLLEPYYGTNILLLNKKNLRESLLNIAYIKEIEVRKSYPATLVLYIKERDPVARIINNERYILFSSDGFIVENNTIINRVKVPEIKGLGYSFHNQYVEYTPILESIVQALEGISLKTRGKIDFINYQNKENTIIAYNGKVPIYFGQPVGLIEKFRVLEYILNKIQEEDLAVEYIDLKIINKPVVKIE